MEKRGECKTQTQQILQNLFSIQNLLGHPVPELSTLDDYSPLLSHVHVCIGLGICVLVPP